METSTKLSKVLLTNSKIKSNAGVYVLYFKGCKHWYCGSSKTLTQRLYHYLNNTSIISSSVKNMLDCMTSNNLMIQLHECDADISTDALLKLEDFYIKQYIGMYGEQWCLNSRTNDLTWFSPKYKEKNKQLHKPVASFCKYTKEKLEEFESITAAVRYYKYQNSGNICLNLKGKIQSTKKMYFEYI